MARPRKPPDTVAALERGIAVLHCFLHGPTALSHGDIARRTGIPKPTVTRLVATLMMRGYLRQMRGDRYALGPCVTSLARAFLSGLDVREAARPLMAALAEQFDASVYLAVRDQAEMVIIEACRSRETMLWSRIDVGSRVPMTLSALGRAYMSALDAPSRSDLLRQTTGPRRPIDRALRDATAHGYCLSAREWHPDIGSVATAIQSPDGVLLALNCGGPVFRFDEQHLRRRVAPRLLDVARAIAQEIGGKALAGTDSRRLAAVS
jgi:IclR family transcriptional regulator, positive regulator for flagellar biogenesis